MYAGQSILSSPMVSSLTVSYSAKQSYYFYTTKFSLGDLVKNGLLSANMTTPTKTEATFGICDTNSADWNDYTVLTPEKLQNINDYKKIKIGIKFTSYSVSDFATVDNFGIFFGSDMANKVTFDEMSSSSSSPGV